MKDLYPCYFEVKAYDGNEEYQEGGFLFAVDWADAMEQIQECYDEDLMSVSLEMLDTLSLNFPIDRARQIRGMIL